MIVNKYLYRRYRETPEERDIQQSEDVEFGTHPRFLKICIMSVLSYIPMAYSGYALRLLLLTCLPCRLQIKYIPLHRFWYPSRTLRKGLKGNRVRIPDSPAAVCFHHCRQPSETTGTVVCREGVVVQEEVRRPAIILFTE